MGSSKETCPRTLVPRPWKRKTQACGQERRARAERRGLFTLPTPTSFSTWQGSTGPWEGAHHGDVCACDSVFLMGTHSLSRGATSVSTRPCLPQHPRAERGSEDPIFWGRIPEKKPHGRGDIQELGLCWLHFARPKPPASSLSLVTPHVQTRRARRTEKLSGTLWP